MNLTDVGSRQPRTVFLTAEWRHLVMVNYEVPVPLLEELVPRGTVLDLWQGRALVSVVGFRFLRTRLLGIPVPFHRNFDEVNLRFYVRRELPDGEVRRGVVFIRELVPRRMIAWVARLAYNEPYRAVPMRSEIPAAPPAPPGSFRYVWRRRTPAGRRWERLEARALDQATFPAGESEPRFITEHYWGYTSQRDGGTIEYEVRHPPWRVHVAEAPQLSADVASLYGLPFAKPLAAAPRSAFVAEGSPVSVFWPRRLR
jgi:uncharacterized protein YqjF (DUF2071 family)